LLLGLLVLKHSVARAADEHSGRPLVELPAAAMSRATVRWARSYG